MGQGFTVKASVLQSQSQDAASLQEYCQAVAADAVEAMAGMAGSAGHQGLESALTTAAGQGDKAFGGMLAAYKHAAAGLASSARTYAKAEDANIMLVTGAQQQDQPPFVPGSG